MSREGSVRERGVDGRRDDVLLSGVLLGWRARVVASSTSWASGKPGGRCVEVKGWDAPWAVVGVEGVGVGVGVGAGEDCFGEGEGDDFGEGEGDGVGFWRKLRGAVEAGIRDSGRADGREEGGGGVVMAARWPNT